MSEIPNHSGILSVDDSQPSVQLPAVAQNTNTSKLQSFPSIEGSKERVTEFQSCLSRLNVVINKKKDKRSQAGDAGDCSTVIELIDEALRQMLLSSEDESALINGCYVDLLDFFLQDFMTSKLESWCMARLTEGHKDPARRVMCQILCVFDTLLSQSRQRLLSKANFTRALLSHLDVCASFIDCTQNDCDVEERLVVVLHQVCVGVTRHSDLIPLLFDASYKSVNVNKENREPAASTDLLELGDSTSSINSSSLNNGEDKNDSKPKTLSNGVVDDIVISNGRTREDEGVKGGGRFTVFSLLIPYIHRHGVLGQQARDALLLLISLSASHDDIATYITNTSNLCLVLATGLNGLYSSLPRTLTYPSDDWNQLTHDDINSITELQLFLTSLEFCSGVSLVGHRRVREQLLSFVYSGFLVPVMGPALHQTTTEEVIAATAYLDICLRTITDVNVMRVFLGFILQVRLDEVCLLDVIISRINSSSMRYQQFNDNNRLIVISPRLQVSFNPNYALKRRTHSLCMVTLTLFRTLVELNCEDVMFQLVFRYLIPCTHVMISQQRSFKDVDIYCETADKLLSLTPAYCTAASAAGPVVTGPAAGPAVAGSAASSAVEEVSEPQSADQSIGSRPMHQTAASPPMQNTSTSVIGSSSGSAAVGTPMIGSSSGSAAGVMASPFQRSKQFLSSFRKKSSGGIMNPPSNVSTPVRQRVESGDNSRRGSVTSETTPPSSGRPSSAGLTPSHTPGGGVGEAPAPGLLETSYTEYLRQAHARITECVRACGRWSARYDGERPSPRALLDLVNTTQNQSTHTTTSSIVTSSAQVKEGNAISEDRPLSSDRLVEPSPLPSPAVDSSPLSSCEIDPSPLPSRVTDISADSGFPVTSHSVTPPSLTTSTVETARDEVMRDDMNMFIIQLNRLSSSLNKGRDDEMKDDDDDDEENFDSFVSDAESRLCVSQSLPQRDEQNSMSMQRESEINQSSASDISHLHENKAGSRLDENISGSRSDENKSGSSPDESKTGSRLDENKSRSKSDESKSGSRSNENKSGSRSDESKSGSRSDESKAGSRSDDSKVGSRSDENKSGSRSDESKAGSRSVESKAGSKSDESKSGSRSNDNKAGSRSGQQKRVMEKQVTPNTPDIGPFLTSLLKKLETMKSNTLYVNLQLTALVSRLACYPQPLLRSLLLSHKLVFQPYVKSLVQVLNTVKCRLDEYLLTLSPAERDSMLVQAQQYLYWRDEVSRLGVGHTPPLPPGATLVTPQQPQPSPLRLGGSADKKRRLSDFFSFGSGRQTKQLELDTRSGARYINRMPSKQNNAAKNTRDSVEKKNAIYCAIIYKEFLKELAAMCQEHILVPADDAL